MAKAGARQQVLEYLAQHREGATDSDLGRALGMPDFAEANRICRDLERAGLLRRRQGEGGTRNYLKASGAPRPAGHAPPGPGRGPQSPAAQAERAAPPPAPEGSRGWPAEGAVRQAVVACLQACGYQIQRQNREAAPQRRRDVEARRGGFLLWATVKGFPDDSGRTSPALLAGQWFKEALFDIVAWRGVEPFAALAIALPDLPAYRRLAEQTRWLQPAARFGYIWAHEDGSVDADPAILEDGFEG